MRLFIAVPVPPDVRRALSAMQAALTASGAQGRFVPQENFHVTLKFLGETDALSDVTEAMRAAVCDAKPFLIRLGGSGAFGRGGAGCVAYAGVTDGARELARISELLESALWDAGFPRGRGRYTPHITLGRNVEGGGSLAVPAPNAAYTADSIILYESRLARTGAVYTPVHREYFR